MLIQVIGKETKMSITSYYGINILYQMDEYNPDYNIVFCFCFVNCVGNPNVYDIRDILNSLLTNYISVSCIRLKIYFYKFYSPEQRHTK
jgi:hypothetical protein